MGIHPFIIHINLGGVLKITPGHNYGHIASDYRSMIDTSMKENIDIIYKKVWIRKQEEQVNKDQVLEIARLTIKRDEENSTEKKKDV
jgi:hypothetical protein